MLISKNEHLTIQFGFRDLIAQHLDDIVQPNIVSAGGITETLKVIAAASTFYMECSLQWSDEFELVASLHLAVSQRVVTSIEGHIVQKYLPSDLRSVLLTLGSGRLRVPDGPGLGLPFRNKVMDLMEDF